jgi:hypothetical protein
MQGWLLALVLHVLASGKEGKMKAHIGIKEEEMKALIDVGRASNSTARARAICAFGNSPHVAALFQGGQLERYDSRFSSARMYVYGESDALIVLSAQQMLRWGGLCSWAIQPLLPDHTADMCIGFYFNARHGPCSSNNACRLISVRWRRVVFSKKASLRALSWRTSILAISKAV